MAPPAAALPVSMRAAGQGLTRRVSLELDAHHGSFWHATCLKRVIRNRLQQGNRDDRQHHPAPGHQPPVRPRAQWRGREPGVLPARFADLWLSRADLLPPRRRHRTAARAELRGLIDPYTVT